MSHNLPIRSVMRPGTPIHCTPETTLATAASMMAEQRCSSIIVMEEETVVGIWTEHDALLVDFSDPTAPHRPISEAMSTPVVSLSPETTIAEAALRFRQEQRRHYLVADQTGKIAGILSQTDIALNQGLEPYLRLREVHSALRQSPLMLAGNLKLAEAARQMYESRHDAVVIECDDDTLGVLTERDMLRFIASYPGNTEICTLASRPLLTIGIDAPLIQARDRLLEHRIRHLGVTDAQGRVVGLLGFSDLIAGAEHLYLEDLRQALEQRDQALAESRRYLQLAERVIDSSLEGIIITDPNLVIQFVNPAFTQLTGYQPEEAIGRTPALLSSGRHDRAFYQQLWRVLRKTGCWRGEVWNRRKTGELFLELLTITTIRNDDGEVSHYAGLFTDITQHRQNEEKIRQLAYYDPLTGLPNRRLLDDRLAHAIRQAHRKQQVLAILFIDLDHFKEVNDTYGHAAGDQILTEATRRFQACLREDDTLARLGGDEFIALLSELEDHAHASRIASRLIEANSRPYQVGDARIQLGTSIGISLYPFDGQTGPVLIEAADQAMYQAKRAGRNQLRLAGYAEEVSHP